MLETASACARLSALCARVPHLHAIRTSLAAPRLAKLRNALSLFTASARVAYATAFLEARAALSPEADSERADAPIARATALRADALEFQHALAQTPRVRHPCASARAALVDEQIRSIAGPGPEADAPRLLPEPPLRAPGPLELFEHASHMCMASLCDGWEMDQTVRMWARVQLGTFSKSGRTFIPGPRTPQSPERDWAHTETHTITRALGESPVCIYISHGEIVAIVAGAPLRTRPATRAGASPPSLLDLPSFIALPRDASGRPIIPKSRVTALVEAQEAWHHELGQLDSLSSTIVRGLLVMPKIAVPSQRKVLRNHPSWEDDPAAQQALGPIIAKWLAQGVLEYVQWDDRQPVLLQPCGAVPKGTAPFFRLITDARYGNSMYSDWGVTYSSAADLCAALHPRDFTWSADLQDAYHLSVFAGCGGELRPCKRPIVQGDGTLSWVDGFIVGCDPASCLGGCDKDMSGLSISGHVFRFAACQFGQKTAGSPLNCLVMSVARYFARLPTPVHVATWVDDLHFSMRTPDHPPCDGHVGGCPTCSAAYDRAVQAEALWRAKAKALNLPLSEGKGHSVAQGGPFTGVHIDTLRGQYTMLADKLVSLRSTLAALVNAESSTPRLLAQGRGKAAHYGCAIPYLASMCPALTQAMHQAERAFDLPPPGLADESADPLFDWDQPLPVSTRTRAALRLMLQAVDDFGSAGQPIWPLPTAAALGLFRASRPDPAGRPIAVASAHVNPAGWGLTLRTGLDHPPFVFHGPWAPARALVSASWMAQLAFSADDCPLDPGHQLALAVLIGLQSAASHLSLADFTLLIRLPCPVTARALTRGSSQDPALQDMALLLQAACMSHRLLPPLFHPSPPPSPPAPLGAAARRAALADSASPRLRVFVQNLVQAIDARLSIDLFASAANAQCPRYYSRDPEASSAGTDAFAQVNWADSPCPWCRRSRPDFVLLYPPHGLAGRAIARARQDQAHGIAILPCAQTAPWWPTIMAASRSLVRPFQPFHRLRCSSRNVDLCTSPPGYHLAILHFDFWRGAEPRPRRCLHSELPRPTDSDTLLSDTLDRQAFEARQSA